MLIKKEGDTKDMAKTKFQDWAIIWGNDKKNYVKESTYATYMIMIQNHLIPELGEYYMEDIQKDVIQRLIIDLRNSGRVDRGGGLSDKSVRDIIAILKICLRDYGMDDSWIYRKNALKYPVNDKISKMQVLSKDMYEKMMISIKREMDFEALGYAVSLYTGMRIGEVCALRWEDIDMEQEIISVTKTLQRVYFKEGKSGKTKLIIGPPKSKAAVRDIPISQALKELLLRRVCKGECYLLSGTTKAIEPRLYRKHFERFLERNGLEPIRFHSLRHTFATRCIERGADCKTVSCLLGHASVSLTLSLYVHPQWAQKKDCVERI